MIDQIFDRCVQMLEYSASILGITYKEINVGLFVFAWPALTILMLIIILAQRREILRLREKTK